MQLIDKVYENLITKQMFESFFSPLANVDKFQ